jgi:hypothetical protein
VLYTLSISDCCASVVALHALECRLQQLQLRHQAGLEPGLLDAW